MSCFLQTVSFVLLLGSIGTQVVSFLSSHMVTNRLSDNFHDGIFHRCGAMQYFQTARQYVNSFMGRDPFDGSVVMPGGCWWWNSRMFEMDEKSMRAVTVLSLISCAAIVLIFLFFLISLIDRFKSNGLNLFIATLLMFNAILISGIIIVYTLLYAKDAKFYPGVTTPLLFSWGYWALYAVAGGNLMASVVFCCQSQRHKSHYTV